MAAPICLAQQFTPNPSAAMRWRMIGPFRGGRALAAVGVPGDPNTYYFGGVGGGVWKSTDAGEVWQPIFDSAPVQSIGAIAVAPSNPQTLYIGSGEADMRSDISFGDGMYKSTDGGKTWQHIGLEDTQAIGKIVVDPRDPNLVLAAALGHPYGPNSQRGVFRSSDGGATWQRVLYKDENTGAIDLAFDPADPQVIYAALWQARRTPWSQYPPEGGAGSGLYKSTDGGLTWHELTGNGLPAGTPGRIGIAVAPSDPNRVYAVIESKEGGLFRSNDAGATWQRVGTDPRIDSRAWYFSQVTVDPKNADTVYMPNVSLYRSRDGGKTFAAFKGAPGGDDYHSLWIDPGNPTRMILASDQGVSVSVDEGTTWSSWYNQPTAQFYHVATDNQFPYWVYGAQQDSGTAATQSRGDYGEITYREWHPVGGGESGYIVPDPDDPNITFAGDTYGGLWHFDQRTGQTQNIGPEVVASFGTPISQRSLRFTWTSPLVFAPRRNASERKAGGSRTLYYGSQYIMASADGGGSWKNISPDLTGCDPAQKSASGPVTVANARERCYGVVYTIAPSPVDSKVIWAGSDSGLIHVTRDAGKTWQDVTPWEPPSAPIAGPMSWLGPWSKVALIEASHFDVGTAYAAVDWHRLDDFDPHILRTRDFGRHWTDITNGIPRKSLFVVGSGPAAPATPLSFVHVVREDPLRRGLLFAGTESGIYVSFDDGDHWQSLQLNLPHVSVRDLAIHGDDLIAATHGRSFWILDNITPLRQLTPQVAAASVHLFQPAVAIRARRSVRHDTPLPPEFPAGENPPAGAIVDYWLQSAAPGEVTLEILDSKGGLVRKYSSSDKAAPPSQPLTFPDYWLRPPAPLPTAAGLGRFVWDLRYPSPPSVFSFYTIAAVYGQNTPALPEGALVLPGTYTIRLTVAGRSYTQPLTIKPDPRISATAADLEKQFSLAMSAQQGMVKSFAALTSLKKLEQQLASLSESSEAKQDSRLLAAINALQTKAHSLAEARAPQASFAVLNGAFAQIEDAVESADRAPTLPQAQADQQGAQQLQALLSEWRAIQQHDLPALNQMLSAKKLPGISTSWQ